MIDVITVPKAIGVKVTPPTATGAVEKRGGNELTSEPRTMRTAERIICPIATVAKIVVTTGARCNGRNATRSTKAPIKPTMMHAPRTAAVLV